VAATSKKEAIAVAQLNYPPTDWSVLNVIRAPNDDWRIEYDRVWEPLWRNAIRNAPKPRNRRMASTYALRLCLGFRTHQAFVAASKRSPKSAKQKKLLRALGGPNGRLFMKLRLTQLRRDKEFDWEGRM
jgi:hypothetical protein